MNNTAIITKEEGAINSRDFWGYAIKKVLLDAVDANRVQISKFHLVACRKSVEANVVICIFDDRQLALDTLGSLLQAIDNGERLWDIHCLTLITNNQSN